MSEQAKYSRLFEPYRLGSLALKNRIVMPAMAVAFASDEGHVTKRLLHYFTARARGGVGFIIVGYTSVDYRRGRTGPNKLSIDDDRCIPGLSQLVETVHGEGLKVAVQLNHGGGYSPSSLTGLQPVAPSAVFCRPGGDLPHPLTEAEIEEIVGRFAAAAGRAVKAGFDALEIHAASGYLINQFLSPSRNKRQDKYGGSLENRARFLLEIVGAIRQKMGKGYPLSVRINGSEYGIPGGITVDNAVALAVLLEKAGVDAVNVTYFGARYPFVETEEPDGSFIPLAAAVKKAVKVPVIAVGRISPRLGEEVLREGKADLVAIGRALLADPELPLKAFAGREEDINPCITCRYCGFLTPHGETGCMVNPVLGREGDFNLRRTEKVKRVLVVGGGPAGMQAARVAALRGHEVTLVEKGQRLGGLLHTASRVPGYSRIADLARYSARQVEKAGVKVERGRAVTAATLEAIKPDAVVLATGARITLVRRVIAGMVLFLARMGYPGIQDKGLLLKSPTKRRQILGVQTPLLAAARPNQELLSLVRGRVDEVYLAGDCLEPSGIMQALTDGERIGHSL
ncbi:MAG: oxidase [Dehalococcoidia bacterium]|nr:oxidase [Dehalococcoidia bacterium]